MQLTTPHYKAMLCLVLFLSPFLTEAQKPLEISQQYLEQNLKDLGLNAQDIEEYRVRDMYVSKHNGLTHVYLNQTYESVDIYNAIININILPNGEVLNAGNRFVPNLLSQVNSSAPSIGPDVALEKVLSAFDLKTGEELRIQTQKSDKIFIFEPTDFALEAVPVQLIYTQTEEKSVRLAWQVELYQLDAQHWWNVRVDAQSGAVLGYHDQVIHCDFDAPYDDCSEHDHASMSSAAVEHKNFVLTDSSAYNIFPLFTESPNHGDRALIIDPSDDIASPFGWHDTDGNDGPEYTITRGNNVHAYHDIFATNASIGDEPDGGEALNFDFPLDLSTNLPYTQIDPAVVNLFYWNNLVHDVWYQYGFDEASGNFQANNYGNGGLGGDWVIAEALDGGGTNNANFGTPADGSNGRMQMYVWTNSGLSNQVVIPVLSPEEVAGNYAMQPAGFGGELPNPSITGEVVLVDDGVGVGTDACEDILNGEALVGKVAMIDRGECEFGAKMLKAEEAGAIAVIICNNVPDPEVITMGAGAVGASVTIPGVMLSLASCNTLKTILPDSTLTIELGISIPNPGPSGRTGDFDNGIIVHEYGHGISNRLTGGPSNSGCLNSFEQAGEGWSDWFGLVMTTTSENNANEGRGIGTFAVNQSTTGGGIREYRYSRNINTNPHTYADVLENTGSVHGIGSVWCAMIWDLYWDLVDEYGFDDDIYNGTGGNNIAMQLVLDGLKLQSCNPSFIDSRDAILAADVANYGGANQCLIWETFARRGLGFSASAGGNEAFDIPLFCFAAQVIKTAVTEVNAGGTVTYTLEIQNNEEMPLTNVTITDELPEGTTYVEGSLSCAEGTVSGNTLSITFDELSPENTIICTYELQVDNEPFTYVGLEDDVENGTDLWNVVSPVGTFEWTTSTNSNSGNLAWFASDPPTQSDQYLTLAMPLTLAGQNPALSFWHWYDTEREWDGGVVEISLNSGNTWQDLGSRMIQNGYPSNLQVNEDSPISGRPAFNGDSEGYIQTVIDLTGFGVLPIMIRFRMATDASVGGNGWYVDDIQFYENFLAITNTACIEVDGEAQNCSVVSTTIVGEPPVSTQTIAGELSISIAPNPSKGNFALFVGGTGNTTLNTQVLSVDGRVLRTDTFDRSSGTFEINLTDFAPGVYFLSVQTDHGHAIEKIIIQ
jgi:uncharacterized repeat protein (TIGR01451 family)